MISLRHIVKRFGYHTVFDDFNLELPETGLFLFVGENGCGKSTLLYLLACLDDHYQGEYFINGRNMGHLSDKEADLFRRKEVGLLFSHGNLFTFMNSEENRCFDIENNTLKFVDLPKDENVRKLSGGEELLLALSNELAKKKKIYLLDEVTSALDKEHLEQVLSILTEQSKKSLIIMATHDKRIMERGEKIFIGNSRQISSSGDSGYNDQHYSPLLEFPLE